MNVLHAHPPAHPHHSRFRLWFWLACGLLLVTFLVLVKAILLPFVVGMMAAYFLDPAVRRLRARGWSRGTSAAVITAAFFALTLALGFLLVPPVIHQSEALLQQLPDVMRHLEQRYGEQLQYYATRLAGDQADIKDSLGNYGGAVMGWVGGVVTGALESGLALLNLFSLIFITPIVAFYLLRDWNMVVARFFALLPRDKAHTVRQQLHAIDVTLSGFIRGQTHVCLIFAVYYGVLLSLAKLNFGLLIGIATGLLLFIPFAGFATCFVLSMIIALFQYPDNAHILAVFLIYLAGLALENSFVTPKLVGDKVGLHPLWIIFGMLAGAELFGFVGVLLSVPVTAVIGVLVRFAIKGYLHSTLYTGETSLITEPAGTKRE